MELTVSFASLDGCLDLIQTLVNYISKCTEEEALHDRVNRFTKKQVLINLFNSLIASTITVCDVLENAPSNKGLNSYLPF